MFERVKENLKEVLEIAEKCPEIYKVKCFEVLLQTLAKEQPEKAPASVGQIEDLKSKATFFAQHNIQDEQWQKVFYFDGSKYEIIVKDLNESTATKKQVKLALLLGIKSLLESNEPFVDRQSLVELCKQYSCYDQTNFSKPMKRNKQFFLEKPNGWILTMPGKQKAIDVIKELA